MGLKFPDITKEKLGRKEYIISFLIFAIGYLVLKALIGASGSFGFFVSNAAILGLVMLLDVKRLKDIGWSPKFAAIRLLILLPFLIIIPLTNMYGTSHFLGLLFISTGLVTNILNTILFLALVFMPSKKADTTEPHQEKS